ncbi:MAG: hypothetical protein O7C67_10905 [Gammaproteobacteria bacterium]|nr:hypothetical protein [Gammaproteobacteria bacterium]
MWRPACSIAALEARAKILATIRAFFDERGVIEVQTPTLSSTTVTDPQIASIATQDGKFLQTSPEYQMKRLLAAGAPSIYQMGPAYRAGESGRLHNPEFTMLEWYRLGFDDDALMAEVAELVDLVLGPRPYQRLTYRELVGTRQGQRDLLDLKFTDALANLDDVRVFITDYPADQAALARLREKDAGVAARFELVVDGVEVANGYFELTDPDELEDRFNRDNAIRDSLGVQPVASDERLLAAMRHGLPDCAGVALGVDRLVMLALGASNLSEVMPFPAG